MVRDSFCPCDECGHCIGNSDPEWGCECDLCGERFGLTLKQIFEGYFEDFVKEEMAKGLTREEAEEEVRSNHQSRDLVYCPDAEARMSYDEYMEGYYDYCERQGEAERECC